MDSETTLREILDRLVADPSSDLAATLRGSGFDPTQLPADLVGQTVVSYCDTAPIEVAEHLEPFVTAVTSATDPDPFEGLDLLASVPTAQPLVTIDSAEMVDTGGGTDSWVDFDFGAGGPDFGAGGHGPIDTAYGHESAGAHVGHDATDVYPSADHAVGFDSTPVASPCDNLWGEEFYQDAGQAHGYTDPGDHAAVDGHNGTGYDGTGYDGTAYEEDLPDDTAGAS